MIVKRCAWHWVHRLAIMGVSTWWPLWPLSVSDGICPWCARQVLRVGEFRGRSAWAPIATKWGRRQSVRLRGSP